MENGRKEERKGGMEEGCSDGGRESQRQRHRGGGEERQIDGKREGHNVIEMHCTCKEWRSREGERERLNLCVYTDEVIVSFLSLILEIKLQNSPPYIALATNLTGG